jgi:uncharacterized spore protein YtfJ
VNVEDILNASREAVDIRQVFGEPYERGGVTVIPVARVTAGGGGGSGSHGEGGSGRGYGYRAEPAGVFVIRDGKVQWQPAVNANKIVAGGMAVAAVAVLTAPRILKQIHKIARDWD